MVFGRGIYLALSLALVVAILILRNYLNFVNENGLLVVSGAFVIPLLAVVLVTAFFLAFSAVSAIARERDQGTLEVLFYGPVDAVAYILGKYLAHLGAGVVMALIYSLCFFVYAGLTNFTFSLNIGWMILLALFISSDLIVVGIFLSTLSSRVRTALLLFLSLLLIFLVIEIGPDLLALIPYSQNYYNPVLFLQELLTAAKQVTAWLSPLAYLSQGLEAIRRGATLTYLTTLLIAGGYTVIFLGLSVVTLERKGVRK
jgi:ABC-type transport system involved in multi-copper enzyme maturation permease subunit